MNTLVMKNTGIQTFSTFLKKVPTVVSQYFIHSFKHSFIVNVFLLSNLCGR